MNRTQKSGKSYIKCVLFGTLWGIAVSAVLLIIFSSAGLLLEDPARYAPIFALCAFFSSGYVASFAGAKLYGRARSRAGVLSGIIFVLLLVLTTFAFGTKIKLPLLAVCVPIAIVLSLLGDVSGSGHGRRRKSGRRKVKF